MLTSYGFEGYTDDELIDELKNRGYIVRKSKIKELVNKNIDQIIEDRF